MQTESAFSEPATIPEVGSFSLGDVEAWLERYRRAWEEGDADAAAGLFTDEAVYRSSPFREPHPGQDGIREYWTKATGTQTDTRGGATRTRAGAPNCQRGPGRTAFDADPVGEARSSTRSIADLRTRP